MSRQTLQLDGALHEYVLEHGVREDEILAELRKQTAELPESNMQIAPEQGQFISFLVRVTNTKDILEIGTFTGYSALWMAKSLGENGSLTACDKSEEWTSIARDYWNRAGVAHKIDLQLGDARETIQTFDGEQVFDFIFIDADKSSYPFYYEKGLELLSSNGIIAIDNTLWSGAVVDPSDETGSTKAIRSFNESLKNDERVEISMVPIGDGLTLVTPD